MNVVPEVVTLYRHDIWLTVSAAVLSIGVLDQLRWLQGLDLGLTMRAPGSQAPKPLNATLGKPQIPPPKKTLNLDPRIEPLYLPKL